MQKLRKKILIIDLIVLVILAVALAVSMKWSYDIELKLGLLYYVDSDDADEKDIVTPRNLGVYVSSDGDGSASVDGLYIHYVDVGQGDCTLIEFPDGKTMIIDGGENKKSTEAAIDAFIADNFPSDFKYFDYAVLTHPDSDHCGSLDYVLQNYPARVSYRPNVEAVGTNSNPYVDPDKDRLQNAVTKNTAAYANCIKAMYAPAPDFTPTVHITDPADETQTITGGTEDNTYTFTFYSPLSQSYSDWNDYSPIMILSYRGYNFALSGDAEKKNEEEFVAKVESAKTDGVTDKYDIFTDDFTVNAIKCGHHGSRTSTSQAYIDAITTPDGAKNAYYIISCGEGNSYGHPHSETLDRLEAMNVPQENILRTDVVGDITLSVRADDAGEFKLFYGDKATVAPDVPDVPETPDPDPDTPAEQVLIYRTLGGIKLKWAVVAWSCYAVLVVLAVVHVACAGMFGSDGGSSKHNGGATSRGNSSSGNRRRR
ncbi:MAG: MBL fold metallo-hydrolase [Clostridiales bacterium]|nr:MBL fold metallo-hydrolase [Clostridiales bacterium]